MLTLVTGATGRVGSRFTPRLIARGSNVRVLIRDPAAARRLSDRGAELAHGDLCDRDSVRRALKGVDAVVHLAAAFRGVPDEESRAVNDAATAALAKDAVTAAVSRFVFTSTNLVYGPGHGRPAREDDPTSPTWSSAYPETKVAAERGRRTLDGLGLRILRLAFVYGDGDPHLAESLRFTSGWPTHQRIHMIHHADVAQALIRALDAEGVDGRIYNAADDAPASAYELHVLNHQEPAARDETQTLGDPWYGIVDTTRIRRELGFRPIYPSVHTARDAGAL